MEKSIVYWESKNGKINIDEMSIEHLRNTLKMIVNQNKRVSKEPYKIAEFVNPDHSWLSNDNSLKKSSNKTSNSIAFSDEECRALTRKTQSQFDNEDNMWK